MVFFPNSLCVFRGPPFIVVQVCPFAGHCGGPLHRGHRRGLRGLHAGGHERGAGAVRGGLVPGAEEGTLLDQTDSQQLNDILFGIFSCPCPRTGLAGRRSWRAGWKAGRTWTTISNSNRWGKSFPWQKCSQNDTFEHMPKLVGFHLWPRAGEVLQVPGAKFKIAITRFYLSNFPYTVSHPSTWGHQGLPTVF